ncbi:helix-turn-helix transcriptional regulator [Streptomyces sp. JJ36]|uniref:helix-turn-helix domain-containing protein n=1 Tax=Streptomyces sp. JJ36 TaxID=2736645 RepID=UPI001F3B48A9|nr:helix-turn-helix transcriptional regulator [Streptomyces sp. JJ36]MCF6525066.1 helix-turn-helix domain-containing protein [Streptomyces sp. JJ36]
MPARAIVTARQERLGAELRLLREQAGLTAREAARNLSIDQTKISHIEAGRVGVSDARVRRLAAHYACNDRDLVDALAAMATERHRGWWESYRDTLPAGFLDLAELEHHAAFLQMAAIVHVPGLLQTPDYARAVFSYALPELSAPDLEARVEHRMQRKTVLRGAQPTDFVAIVHEAALRIMVADRPAARRQLQAVIEASTADNISVHVIPFTAEGFAGAGYSMLHAGGPTPRLDTIQLDRHGGNNYLYAEAQLNKYRQTFRKLMEAAIEPSDSRDFLHRLLKEL